MSIVTLSKYTKNVESEPVGIIAEQIAIAAAINTLKINGKITFYYDFSNWGCSFFDLGFNQYKVTCAMQFLTKFKDAAIANGLTTLVQDEFKNNNSSNNKVELVSKTYSIISRR